jgi:hypothetical protein
VRYRLQGEYQVGVTYAQVVHLLTALFGLLISVHSLLARISVALGKSRLALGIRHHVDACMHVRWERQCSLQTWETQWGVEQGKNLTRYYTLTVRRSVADSFRYRSCPKDEP